ncbi:MAG: glycosyltransferase family 4 protein [bacterium]
MTRRLLVVSSDFGIPLWGTKGASVHLRAMVRAFAGAGLEVGVAVRGVGEPHAGESLGAGTRTFVLPDSPRPKDRTFTPERMNDDLSARLVEIGSTFRFEAIYERAALWSLAPLEFARRAGMPHLVEVNAPLSIESARWRDLPHARAARAAEERLAQESSRLFPVSSPIANFLVALGADRGRIVTLPNAVDEAFLAVGRERMTLLAAHRPAHRPFTIGFVGSLKPWHGIETLLAAYRILEQRTPNVRLLVVGDGPLAARVREEAARGAGIEWIGAVPHGTVAPLLTTMDVAVAPYDESGDGYFSPLKVLEYQAAGVPVVASGGRGVEDLVVDGESGILVPSGDAPRLSEAITRLRDDGALALRVASRAFVRVSSRTWARNAEKVIASWTACETDVAAAERQAAR